MVAVWVAAIRCSPRRVMIWRHNFNNPDAMTKSELVEALSLKQTYLQFGDVDASVDIILEAIARAMCRSERIEIRGFGSFYLRHRPARVGRNPKTGEGVAIEASRMPHFRPGKELRLRVHASAATPVPVEPQAAA